MKPGISGISVDSYFVTCPCRGQEEGAGKILYRSVGVKKTEEVNNLPRFQPFFFFYSLGIL